MEDAMREISALMNDRGQDEVNWKAWEGTPHDAPDPTDGSKPDPMEFGLMMTKVLGGSKKSRPADRSANDVQVDIILNQADHFAKLNDQYTETYVVKGTKALYELLAAIYGYALQIDESPLREHILQRMRQILEQRYEQKTQANTHWITTVLRYILPRDRQTAFNYSRVLQVAYEENLTQEELPEYIKEAGGIAKVTQTKEKKVQAEQDQKRREAAHKIVRGFLLAHGKFGDITVEVPDKLTVDMVGEEESESQLRMGLFAHNGKGDLVLVRMCRITDKLEAKILAPMAESCVELLPQAKANLDQLRANHGITFGFGIEAGDKGFRMPGHIDITHEERMAEINAELQARDREMTEELKVQDNKAEELVSEITIPDDKERRGQEILAKIRERGAQEAARKAEMEREPSE